MLKFRSVIASRSSLLYAKMHQIVFCGWAISGPKGHLTRSSAVAMIADRTTYDVRHTAHYQSSFGYKLTNGWYARSDSTGRVYERTQTQSTQLKRD